METMKIIDILVKKANGEEIPKIIEYRTNYYKLVERNEGNFNYRLIDYPSMRECDDYLEDDYFIFNILNHEVDIIEDTPKEDKKIKKLYFSVFDYNRGEEHTLKQIENKFNEIIDKINGGEND